MCAHASAKKQPGVCAPLCMLQPRPLAQPSAGPSRSLLGKRGQSRQRELVLVLVQLGGRPAAHVAGLCAAGAHSARFRGAYPKL